jgi:hypothetical protein
MPPGPGSPYFGGDEIEEAIPVPDGVSPIVAYRAWRLEEDGTVSSLHHEATWSPSTWVEAQSHLRSRGSIGGDDHPAPAEGCWCGIHALKTLRHLQEALAPRPSEERTSIHGFAAYRFAVGMVELAGKVIEHEIGYRAERARMMWMLPVTPSMERVAWDGWRPGARHG